MKIPLSWLSDFMDLNNTLEEYVDMLNQLGFEVEGIEEPGKEISGVILVDVLATAPHPNADKLKLVDIDTGTEHKTIVCGAPNVRAGLRVAYAPSGATLPGGLTLSEKDIRGVVSDGMLCSARELGLGDDHDGIMELDVSLPIGGDAVKELGLDDAIIELSITPNRPDAMSVVGIARELCAGFNQELKLPDVTKFLDGVETDDSLPAPQVTLDDADGCPRFVGRTLSVKVGPSPVWMSQRLTKAGQKSHNNVVDVTNYVLLEWGRPLHVFDLDVIGSAHLVVRPAHDGEKLALLDETERVLDASDMVVATDDGKAHSIAGIMGGIDSGTYETTSRVYLESAHFTADRIAKTSKRLGVRSESSARFERGTDPNFAEYGSHRAIQLLAEVADAKMSSQQVDVYPSYIDEAQVPLRVSRVERVLGDYVSKEDIVSYLEPLVSDIVIDEGTITVRVPTFRPDLTREIDLIEEVARRRGLNTFEPTLPSSLVQIGGLSSGQKKRRLLEDVLVGAGFSEAYSLPLESTETYAPFGYSPTDLVATKNALRSDASILRPMITPGLVRSARRNHARGIDSVSFFEIGNVFNLPFDENLQPVEETHVCAVLSGSRDERPFFARREVDVFDATDTVKAITDSLGVDTPRIVDMAVPGFHPTRSAHVYVGEALVGVVGQILGDDVIVACELNLTQLLQLSQGNPTYTPLSGFPHVSFDLALVVAQELSVSQLADSVTKHGGKELESLTCFDIFEGGSLGDNKKSVAFALRVRPLDKTWSDDDVARYRAQILDGVAADCGAQLRL